jgi:hypothetical protein
LTVLAVNVPLGGPGGMSEDQLKGHLGELLSETYGFLHYGFILPPFQLDAPKHRNEGTFVVMDGGYRLQ